MNERIRRIRKYFDLTQEKFGEKIGLKQNSIALIESGRNNTSDSIVKLICKEFGVSEVWLRSGQGEMFDKTDESFVALSAKIEKTGDEYVKELTKMLWSFDVDELKVIQKIIKSIKNNPNL